MTRRAHRLAGRGLLGLLAAAVTLLLVEGLLRLWPVALPAWYRSTRPLMGIDLLYPGILERTPIEGVPIPYRFDRKTEYRGGGPARDLEVAGLVPHDQNPDWRSYPALHRRADRNGFLNPTERERADLLLVGDSYTHAMGVLSPPGLQGKLERATGLTLFNLGLPAVGPQREEWLLENYGLALAPRAVVWFFFGGNDLEEAEAVAQHRSRGVETYADLFPNRSRPKSLLVDLVRAAARRPNRPAAPALDPLPPFRLQTTDGNRPVWFSPTYLRRLTRPRDQLEHSEGWRITRQVLARVARRLAEREAPLLIVFLPTKSQVLHDLVDPDPTLLLRVANHGLPRPMAGSPEELGARIAGNAGAVDEMLGDFCRDHGIDFLSLTTALRVRTSEGTQVYLSGDTHWNEHGQEVAREPLIAWLHARGLIAAQDTVGEHKG